MNDLSGKKLVALGDSLIYGGRLGNDATWVSKLAAKRGMTVFNYGINGNTVAAQDIETKHRPMCERYEEMEDGADFVVVLGGANDKRLSVPLGENGSTDKYTFKGALNLLIAGLTAKYPQARILFLTNYNRWPSKNKVGLSDIDYVEAMKEICGIWAMPCFDNYHCCGISFQNPAQIAWADAGVSLGLAPDHHFSEAGYDRLLTVYEALLENL